MLGQPALVRQRGQVGVVVALAFRFARTREQPFQARQGQLTVSVIRHLGSGRAKRDNQGEFRNHGSEIVNFRLVGQ
ncbi:hypothetical protein [Ralstonia sp. GP101]|uniref:hypothetical protein n=1 Tax=Ralstonia sp. GP101 TaxID=3035146 RepID=UPI0038916BC8